MCPPELKLKVQIRKLNYIRIWIILMNIVYLIFLIRNFKKPTDQYPFYLLLIYSIYLFFSVAMLIKSFFGHISIIKILIILLQIRNYLTLYQHTRIMESPNAYELLWGSFAIIIIIIWTHQLMTCFYI